MHWTEPGTWNHKVLNVILFWILKPEKKHTNAMAPSLNHWIKCHSELSRALFREKHKSPKHVPMWRADCPSATVSYVRVLQRLHWTNWIRTRADDYSTLDLRYRAYGYTLHVKTFLVNLGDQSILEKKSPITMLVFCRASSIRHGKHWLLSLANRNSTTVPAFPWKL